jgi:hypothetical protein
MIPILKVPMNADGRPLGPELKADDSTLSGAGNVYRIPYPRRLTTFMDILCWTNDVKNLEAGRAIFTSMEAVQTRIANCKANIDSRGSEGRGRHDARMTAFSDCLALSYEDTSGAAARALADAAFLGHVMLRGGFLPRGAITLGRLYHTDAAMFGGAFLDAFALEQNVAIYPRILISDDVMELARQCPEFQADHHTRVDADGHRYVHVLSMNWPFLRKEQIEERAGEHEGSGITHLYEELRAMLPIRFSEGATPEQRRKIEWMRDYVNKSIDEQGLNEQKVVLPS